MGKIGSRMASSSFQSSSSISTLRSTRSGFVGILIHQAMSLLLYVEEVPTSVSLGVECFQPSLDISGELCISSSLNSTSIHISGRTCHKSCQASNSSRTSLERGSLASQNTLHIRRYSS